VGVSIIFSTGALVGILIAGANVNAVGVGTIFSMGSGVGTDVVVVDVGALVGVGTMFIIGLIVGDCVVGVGGNIYNGDFVGVGTVFSIGAAVGVSIMFSIGDAVGMLICGVKTGAGTGGGVLACKFLEKESRCSFSSIVSSRSTFRCFSVTSLRTRSSSAFCRSADARAVMASSLHVQTQEQSTSTLKQSHVQSQPSKAKSPLECSSISSRKFCRESTAWGSASTRTTRRRYLFAQAAWKIAGSNKRRDLMVNAPF
jgi:hypothetical protein